MNNPITRLLKACLALTVLLAVVAGIPWLLVTFAGWPLPDHVPSASEVGRVLTNPLTGQFLINLLAVLAWLAWAWFIRDLVLETVSAIRNHRQGSATQAASSQRPLRWAAAILIGAIAASLPTAATPPVAVAHAAAVDSTAPPVALEVAAQTADREVHTVRAGDTLWDIADQRLDDPEQWRDIYDENKGDKQSVGGTLTNPNIIHPGWELDIPGTSSAPVEPAPQEPEPADTPPQEPSPSAEGTEDFQQHAPTTIDAPQSSDPTTASPADGNDIPGLALAAGGFVALAFIAGLIMAVRTAHSRSHRYTTQTGKPAPDITLSGKLNELETLTHHDLPVDLNAPPAIGIDHDGNPIPITDTAVGGIGLTGPGAHDAARALIATALTSGDPDTEPAQAIVLIDHDTINHLTDDGYDGRTVDQLIVTESPEATQRAIARETITRTRLLDQDPDRTDLPPVIAILTGPEAEDQNQLSGLLNQVGDTGICGVVLGEWPGTINIHQDGTTTTGNPLGIERCYSLDVETFTDALTTLADTTTTLDEPFTEPDGFEDTSPDEEQEARPPAYDPSDTSVLPDPLHGYSNDDSLETSANTSDQNDDTAEPRTPEDEQPNQADDDPYRLLPTVGESGSEQATPNDENEADATSSRDRARIRLILFGKPTVEYNGKPISLRARGKELLARLAISPEGVHHDTLLETVVADIRLRQASGHLNTVISTTRRALREATGQPKTEMFIHHDPDSNRYKLDLGWFDTDIDEFERHITQANETEDSVQRAAHFVAAVNLHKGPFCDGLDEDTTWTQPTRRHYQSIVLGVQAETLQSKLCRQQSYGWPIVRYCSAGGRNR